MGNKLCQFGPDEHSSESGSTEKAGIIVNDIEILESFGKDNVSIKEEVEENEHRQMNNKLKQLNSIEIKNLKSSIFDNEDVTETERQFKNKTMNYSDIYNYDYYKMNKSNVAKLQKNNILENSINNYDGHLSNKHYNYENIEENYVDNYEEHKEENSDDNNEGNININTNLIKCNESMENMNKSQENNSNNVNDYYSDEFKLDINQENLSNYYKLKSKTMDNNKNINIKASNDTSKNSNHTSIENPKKKGYFFSFKNSGDFEKEITPFDYAENIQNISLKKLLQNFDSKIDISLFNEDFIATKFDFINNIKDINYTISSSHNSKKHAQPLFNLIKKLYIKNQVHKIIAFLKKKSNVLLSDTNKSIKNLPQNLFTSKSIQTYKDKDSNFALRIYSDNSVYSGSLIDDSCNGWGKYSNSKNDLIMGEFRNDFLSGYSIIMRSFKNSYEGYTSKNLYDGIGLEVFADNSKFFGEFKDGKRKGVGTYIWESGSCYQGSWHENTPHGYGILTDEKGKEYQGEFLHGKITGFGLYKWSDGRIYYGYFKNDLRNGFGIFLWKSPIRIYCGFWKDGLQHGFGKLYTSYKESVYLWKKGKRVKKIRDYKCLWSELYKPTSGRNVGKNTEYWRVVMNYKYFFDMCLQDLVNYIIDWN